MKRNKKSSSTIKLHGHSNTSSRKKSTHDEILHMNWPKLTVTKSSVLLPTLSKNKFYQEQNIGYVNHIDHDNMITRSGKS
jgi:alpha-L-fucosidase